MLLSDRCGTNPNARWMFQAGDQQEDLSWQAGMRTLGPSRGLLPNPRNNPKWSGPSTAWVSACIAGDSQVLEQPPGPTWYVAWIWRWKSVGIKMLPWSYCFEVTRRVTCHKLFLSNWLFILHRLGIQTEITRHSQWWKLCFLFSVTFLLARKSMVIFFPLFILPALSKIPVILIQPLFSEAVL